MSGFVGHFPPVTCDSCGTTETPERYMQLPPGWGQVWVRVANSRGIFDTMLRGRLLCADCIKEEMK